MNKNFIQQIKCLFIILFISCFCLSTWGGELHAQNPKLTLKFRDAGMEQIMNEIEKQINYYFIVDKGVDIKRTLTIDVTDKPLTAVLDQLVAGTDTRYRVYQQNIYLSVVKRDASKPVRISGKVIDARGEPVVGGLGGRPGHDARHQHGHRRRLLAANPRAHRDGRTARQLHRLRTGLRQDRFADDLRHHAPRIRRADRRGCRHGPRPHPQGEVAGLRPSPSSAATP